MDYQTRIKELEEQIRLMRKNSKETIYSLMQYLYLTMDEKQSLEDAMTDELKSKVIQVNSVKTQTIQRGTCSTKGVEEKKEEALNTRTEKNEKLKLKIEVLNKELDVAHAEIGRLETTALEEKTATERELSLHKEKIQKMAKKNKELELQAKEKMTKKDYEVTVLNKQLDLAHEEVRRLNSAVVNTKTDSETELTEQKVKIQKLAKKNEELELQATRQKSNQESEVKQLKKHLGLAHEEIRQLKAALMVEKAGRKTDFTKYSESHQDMVKRNERIKRQAMKNEIKMEVIVNDLRKQLNRAQQKLKTSDEEIESAKEKQERNDKMMRALQKEFDDVKDKNKKLEKELEALNEQHVDTLIQNEVLKEELSRNFLAIGCNRIKKRFQEFTGTV